MTAAVRALRAAHATSDMSHGAAKAHEQDGSSSFCDLLTGELQFGLNADSGMKGKDERAQATSGKSTASGDEADSAVVQPPADPNIPTNLALPPAGAANSAGTVEREARQAEQTGEGTIPAAMAPARGQRAMPTASQDRTPSMPAPLVDGLDAGPTDNGKAHETVRAEKDAVAERVRERPKAAAEPMQPLAEKRDPDNARRTALAPDAGLASPPPGSAGVSSPGGATGVKHGAITVPVRDAFFPEAVSQRVAWMATQGIGQAQIQVVPPDLGPIEVRIALEHGSATVHFVAPASETRDALQASLPLLVERLAESGLALGGAFVSSDRPNDSLLPSPDDRQAGNPTVTKEIEPTAPLSAVRRRGLVDEFA